MEISMTPAIFVLFQIHIIECIVYSESDFRRNSIRRLQKNKLISIVYKSVKNISKFRFHNVTDRGLLRSLENWTMPMNWRSGLWGQVEEVNLNAHLSKKNRTVGIRYCRARLEFSKNMTLGRLKRWSQTLGSVFRQHQLNPLLIFDCPRVKYLLSCLFLLIFLKQLDYLLKSFKLFLKEFSLFQIWLLTWCGCCKPPDEHVRVADGIGPATFESSHPATFVPLRIYIKIQNLINKTCINSNRLIERFKPPWSIRPQPTKDPRSSSLANNQFHHQ